MNSILNQTFTDFEVIVVNDGSTDKSGVICDEYAEKDKRVKVFHLSKSGVSVARNVGVNSATGDYIGFVDGDDYIETVMYEKLYEACIQSGSDVSICKLGREINEEIINHNDEEFYSLEMSNEEAMEELFKGILFRFSLCNKLFNKKCFEDVTFPIGRIHEDLSTTYKLFARAHKVVYLNFNGYVYVKRNESILTKSYYEKRLDAFIGWEEILIFMNQRYPQLYEVVNACFAYNSVDHIYFILNQVQDKKEKEKYLKFIQLNIRKYYKQILQNNILAINYKFIVTFFVHNIKLFMIINFIKKLPRNKQ